MENPVTSLRGKNFSVCDAGYPVTSDLRIISNAFSQVFSPLEKKSVSLSAMFSHLSSDPDDLA